MSVLFVILYESGSGSGSGFSKYLTFQDLGLQAKIFRNVDDSSRAVGLPSSLNIGKQSFHTLYVRCSFQFYGFNFVFTLI